MRQKLHLLLQVSVNKTEYLNFKDPNYIRVFFYGMDFLDEELQTQHLFLIKRICRVCGEEKDLVADFYRCRKNPALESSYSYECKECAKKRTIANYYKKSFKSFGTCVVCNSKESKLINDRCKDCDKVLKIVDNRVNILESMIEYIHKNKNHND